MSETGPSAASEARTEPTVSQAVSAAADLAEEQAAVAPLAAPFPASEELASAEVVVAESAPPPAPPSHYERDESGDTAGIVAPLEPEPGDRDWSNELSYHKIVVELKRIEMEVRNLLGEQDPRRKRKLAGTRRWQELEDDIISWCSSDRFGSATLRRMNQLIARRHYLFRRLRFLAGTRPTWNT